MLERILVPLDGSVLAEAVLLHVRGLLRAAEAEVIVLRVVEPSPFDENEPEALKRAADIADGYLQEIEDGLATERLKTRRLVRVGNAADAILAAAESESVSLIAMSTHGHTGVPRFLYGSVSQKVMSASERPVLAVPSFEIVNGGVPTPPSEMQFQRILAAFDGSRAALTMVPIVKSLAKRLRADVILLHVVEKTDFAPKSLAETSLDPAAASFEQARIPIAREFRVGEPAAEILSACRTLKPDLLAITTHGHSRATQWAFGSVAERVIHETTLPVLVVRVGKAGELLEVA